MTIKNKYLLVEGASDLNVIAAILKKRGIPEPENFKIVDCKGIDNLTEEIPVFLKTADIQTLGIIVDADTNLKSRWNSIKAKILSPQKFDLPKEFPDSGLIVTNPKNVKIGVWIMPNNNLNGTLEDFISFLIPPNDQLLPIVHTTLSSIESQNLNHYTLIHKPKATIYTWLAWQKDPGTPLGLSITKRYLNTNEPTCEKLINWFQMLFTENEQPNNTH